MYKLPYYHKSLISLKVTREGESIENKVIRLIQNKEPIKDGAPIIFTDRKEGVKPEYNIKTDRFELAIDAMDKAHKSTIAKRDQIAKDKDAKIIKLNDGKPESTDGETPSKESV